MAKENPFSFEVEKGTNTKIVVAIIEWPPDADQSHMVLDIRTWVKTAKNPEWFATAKGVQVSIEDAKKFTIRLTKIVKAYLLG